MNQLADCLESIILITMKCIIKGTTLKPVLLCGQSCNIPFFCSNIPFLKGNITLLRFAVICNRFAKLSSFSKENIASRKVHGVCNAVSRSFIDKFEWLHCLGSSTFARCDPIYFFTNSLSTVRLQNCLGPPESRNSRSGGRRPGMVDLFPANRTRRGTRRALRILSYLRWRDACLNRFNRGCMGTISIAVNFCVVRVVEFLRNAKLFQSLLASQRVLQCLLLRFFLAELRHSLTILLTVLFELLRAFPSLGH